MSFVVIYFVSFIVAIGNQPLAAMNDARSANNVRRTNVAHSANDARSANDVRRTNVAQSANNARSANDCQRLYTYPLYHRSQPNQFLVECLVSPIQMIHAVDFGGSLCHEPGQNQ